MMKSAAVPLYFFLIVWLGSVERSVAQPQSGVTHLTAVNLPPLSPAKFEGEQTTVKLPGKYLGEPVVGGGGRYLIFQLKDQPQIIIFDLMEARVVNQLDVGSSDLSIAAGANKLIVLLRDQRQMIRFDLQTLKKESSVSLKSVDPAAQILMGAASNGPVLLRSKTTKQPVFLDLLTLTPSVIQPVGDAWEPIDREGIQARASANGRVFCLTQSGRDTTFGTMVIEVRGNQAHCHYSQNMRGSKTEDGEYLNIVLPGPEGKAIYTSRRVYTTDLIPFEKETDLRTIPHGIPAVQGGHSLALVSGSSDINVYRTGALPVLCTVPKVWTKDRWPDYQAGLQTAYARLQYVPKAHVISFLPESRDEIVLHRFDLDATLAKKGDDYLYVSSFPTRFVERGETYQYQLQYKTNSQSVNYKLVQGPIGMKVSTKGEVTWDVPANSTSDQERIYLMLEAPSGKRFLHAFVIHVSYKPGVLGAPPARSDRNSRAARR